MRNRHHALGLRALAGTLSLCGDSPPASGAFGRRFYFFRDRLTPNALGKLM
jgi:hypothetical protein